ncbi:two-component response regulator ORR26-like [Silene latifolia]|uniref:two-component response regulator ORR26-like n=1 Tax=Silene latifolia TaxID=37657 RepID=UPI003D76BB7B
MDQENTKRETPLPPYAVGTKILLIDPDVTSLNHTTSILEESTYRVTGIEIPDIALTMIKEKTNGYDLIIAAANMPGIDCLTYLRSLMAISETPIILISYVADFQLIATALRQGISHFLEKPIKRDEARGLWQFAIRKPRKIIPKKAKNDFKQNNRDIMASNNVKGKGKEIMVQSYNKRKRIDDGKIDNYQSKGKKSDFISNGAETSDGLQWKPQLHEKFMKVLGDDTPQGNYQ